jgi:hypothetical protein
MHPSGELPSHPVAAVCKSLGDQHLGCDCGVVVQSLSSLETTVSSFMLQTDRRGGVGSGGEVARSDAY